MPRLSTSDEWLAQATLLLKAYPTTVLLPLPAGCPAISRADDELTGAHQTIITTKYNIPHPSKVMKMQTRRMRMAPDSDPSNPADADGNADAKSEEKTGEKREATAINNASLELRAYNPHAGVVLKYRTRKAQEVGRLVANLGVLGKVMGALPEDMVKKESVPETEEPERSVVELAKDGKEAKGNAAGGGGGAKKKKKGKK